MKIDLELHMPLMPNFLRLKRNPGLRQEGFKELDGIPVADLTPEQIEQFIKEWGDAFRAHVLSKKDAGGSPR